MNRTYRYTYLRDEDRFPVACVATAYDKHTNSVRVGISTVHPRDKKASYSKGLAKDIAVGRAERSPIIAKMHVSSDVSTHDVLFAVMEALSEADVPTRVLQAIDLWFDKVNAAQKAYELNEALNHHSIFPTPPKTLPKHSFNTDLVPSLYDTKIYPRGF